MTTTHDYRGYVFTITREDPAPAFAVDFPDIPDIITRGSTIPEAFSNACEALDLYLEGLEEAGRPAPEPRHRLAVEVVGSGGP